MSKISIDIPTIEANAHDFENLIDFVHKHEQVLKEFGGIKIQPDIECKQSLKKRRTNFPSCSNLQKVTQISKDELIYSIESVTCNNKSSFDQLSSINENIFWESLFYSSNKNEQKSNLTIFPNQSFYSTRPRENCFNIHRLPKLSLLKIGGSKVIRDCVPSLLRADGPGTIFPLSSAHHRLFSIDYHHQGGNRQWYIIPAEERQKLHQIIKYRNSSICLEHENLLINPSVFHKYHIRYHRLIQHPNQFVVLAAGALAQGFAENASWNETIVFALPSWIQDGHANAQTSSCYCHFNSTHIPQPIDIKQFRYELVQKWTNTNLTFTNYHQTLFYQEDHNNTQIPMPITPIDNQIDLLDALDELTMDTSSIESFWKNNKQKRFSSEALITSSNEFLSERLISPISNYSSHDQNNDKSAEKQSESVQNNSIDFNQLIQSNNINERFAIENNFDEQFSSIDYLANTSIAVQSTKYQMNICQNKKKQEWNCSIINSRNSSRKTIRNKEKNVRNTLFISGLRNEVCKKDLHRHFVGSMKITMKRHQIPPYLKYAFVVHRTYFEAEKNRRRSINYRLFGSECRVEYADKDFHVRYEQQPFPIVVTRIPSNVTENELRDMFIGCQSLKYYPARSTHFMEVGSSKILHNKILSGYAFLQYSNSEQTTNVIQNSDQYQINGQPLHVSLYTKKKSSHLTTK